jgi:chromosome segregation ATPase
VEQTFRAFDTNGDGLISRYEFEKGLRILAVDLTPKLIDQLMSHVDTNNSGFIDYREFRRQFSGNRGFDNSELKRENERLYERLRELERSIRNKDSDDAIRQKEAEHVRAMQVTWGQQRAQFEATIANLQHQLALSMKNAGGGQQRKSQLGNRVAELQAQVNDLRTFYSKKVRALEDGKREAEELATAAEHKLRESREKWGSTKARMTARLTFLERKGLQQ